MLNEETTSRWFFRFWRRIYQQSFKAFIPRDKVRHVDAMHRSSSSGVSCISRTPDTKKPASAGFSPLQPDGQATPVMRVSCCEKSRAMAVVMQGNIRVGDRGEAQKQVTPLVCREMSAPAHTVFPFGLRPRSGHKESGRGRDPFRREPTRLPIQHLNLSWLAGYRCARLRRRHPFLCRWSV